MDSPFCIVVGTPNKDADGELLGISGPALHTLDLMGALVGVCCMSPSSPLKSKCKVTG
jgi:hypothetical protein